MTHFIDLRKKVEPQVKIIYRTVIKRGPWYMELAKVLAVIAVVTTIVWGVSRADSVAHPTTKSANRVKSWSAAGFVSDTSTSTFSITNAIASDEASTAYTFDVSHAKTIETKYYAPITLADINIGDKVILQGTDNNGKITINRIISFAANILDEGPNVKQVIEPILGPVASATTTATSTTLDLIATSTPDVTSTSSVDDIATTTTDDSIATSTPDSNSTTTDDLSTSTPSDETISSTTPDEILSTTTVSDSDSATGNSADVSDASASTTNDAGN